MNNPSWERFFIIPFLQLLCISALINILKLFFQDFTAAIPLLILLAIFTVRVPYSMLKLAPKHAYKATAVYMFMLFCLMQLILFISSYADQEPYQPKGLVGYFVITMIAMMIYRIFHEPEDEIQETT
ncbi:hypothetical protein [Acinetobacter sp. ANC 5054]|uniref:hypothetical protein n=1 Tax=Acinetobacter sp. ANC 5054 TaxID=1977877 RepID=UPI001177DB02|nr:hypothetical protein [Acinetobacter sp. ANC 5054]